MSEDAIPPQGSGEIPAAPSPALLEWLTPVVRQIVLEVLGEAQAAATPDDSDELLDTAENPFLGRVTMFCPIKGFAPITLSDPGEEMMSDVLGQTAQGRDALVQEMLSRVVERELKVYAGELALQQGQPGDPSGAGSPGIDPEGAGEG